MNSPELTETYTRGERIRMVLMGAVLGTLGLAVWKLWVLPWITNFADTAPCRTVFGVSGTTVLWFGLFVGLPLLFAVLFAVAAGRRGFVILREGQCPPRGVKTVRPIRIRKGAAARWIGYLHVLACVPFIALAIWGYGQAVALSHMKGLAPCSAQPERNPPALDRNG